MTKVIIKRKAVGRPKMPKTKRKSKVISIRLTEKQLEDILTIFGSVQKFVEASISSKVQIDEEDVY